MRTENHQRKGIMMGKSILYSLIFLILLFSSYGLDSALEPTGVRLLHDLGYSGEGKTICMIDRGIDLDNQYIVDCVGSGCEVLGGYNFNDNDNDLSDLTGHGTEVAGILSSDFPGYLGVVPDAKLVVGKTARSYPQIKEAIDWCVDKKDFFVPSISVITISTASQNVSEFRKDALCWLDYDKLQSSIDNAVDNNIPVVIAAGNKYLIHQNDGVDYPACLDNVISVGNNDESSDILNTNSKRGEDLDVVAPGTDIITTMLGASFNWNDGISGTSYAAPYIAGGIALIQNYDSGLKPLDIERLLKVTGKPVRDYRINGDPNAWKGTLSFSDKTYPQMDLLSAIGVLTWPMYQHDLRRTGMTILKGEIDEDKRQTSFVLDDAYSGEGVYVRDKPSIADVDSDGEIDIITTSSLIGFSFESKVYAAECESGCATQTPSFKTKDNYPYESDYYITSNPTIEDIDGDGDQEIVLASTQEIIVLDGSNAEELFNYKTATQILYNSIGSVEGEINFLAVADIDLDGEKEILFTDSLPDKRWNSRLYVLSNKLGNDYDILIGNLTHSAGPLGAIAIANMIQSEDACDDVDYPEIVVANVYGLHIYRYDSCLDDLEEVNSYQINGLYSTPVIADLDLDNDYEIIFATTNRTACYDVTGCTNKLIVLDNNGDLKASTSISNYLVSDIAIGRIDSDDSNMEIVIATRDDQDRYEQNGSPIYSTGQMNVYEYTGSSLNNLASFDDGGALDTSPYAPAVADIDGNGRQDIIFGSFKENLYAIELQGASFNVILNESIGLVTGTPAIGDWDDDGRAEIAVRNKVAGTQSIQEFQAQYTILENFLVNTYGVADKFRMERFMMQSGNTELTVISQNNTKPVLTVQEQIIAMEGDNITIIATATDADNDTLTLSYVHPFDENGTWNTVINESGRYGILVTVNDGKNLTDSDYVDLFLLRNDSTQLNISNQTFSSNTSISGQTNFSLDNETRIWLADFELSGEMYETTQTNYTYADAVIMEHNGWNNTNATYNVSNAVDKNDSTYYSAGDATGLIVEMDNLTIPNQTAHIIIKLKLRISDGGSGRFGIYNYNDNVTEIITSSIPLIEDGWVYFDIYDADSALWSTNNTHYSYKVDDINAFVNNTDSVRWYYRYKYDSFADQRVYESKASFKEEETYPRNVTIKLNNKTIFETNELFETTAKTTTFNDSTSNQTITLSTNSTTKYVKIPKDATVTKATITFGNMTTNDINATMYDVIEEDLPVIRIANLINQHTSSPGSGSGNSSNQYTISHNYTFSDTDFDVQYDWSSKCYYNPSGSPISEVYTKLDTNDFYWDYDEQKHTILDGTSLDIKLSCDFSDNYYRDEMKQDTDDRNGNTNYDKTWTTDDYSNSAVTEITSLTVTDSGGDIWGLGYTYCLVENDDHSDSYSAESWNGCDNSGDSSRQDFYIQDCIVLGKDWTTGLNESHIGCSDVQECYDSGASSFVNYCRTPVCSPSCSEWEDEAYASHACSCGLGSGRCDTDSYGWTNVEDDEYCNMTSHYPTDTINITCDDWEIAFIENHTQQCGLGVGRCEDTNTQVNTTHYCDSQNYVQTIFTYVQVDDTRVGLNKYAERLELDITNALNNHLKSCNPDDKGNCLIPLVFASDYNMTTNINVIDLNYETNKIDIVTDLQTQLLNDVENFTIQVSAGKGRVNLTDLRIHSSPNTPPWIENNTITVTEGQNVTITVEDNERDALYININLDSFTFSDRKLNWETGYQDSGIHNLTVNVSDGLYSIQKNITVNVINKYEEDIKITTFGYLNNGGINNVLFYFTLMNNNPYELMVNYTLQTGEDNITTNFTIPAHDTIMGFIPYNYSTNNDFTAILSSTNNNASDSSIIYLSTKQVTATNLSRLYWSGLTNHFEFIIMNDGSDEINNVSWSFDTGDELINSTLNMNLSANETVFVIINHEYNNSGNYNVTSTAIQSGVGDSVTINISVAPITLSLYSVLSLVGSEAVFGFNVNNVWNDSLANVSWGFNTGQNNITSNNFNLTLGEEVFVFVYHNYTSSGNHSTQATASHESYTDSDELTVEVQ